MNALPPRPIDPEAEARRARHLRQLQELAELGMAMARTVAQASLEPPPEAAAADTKLAVPHPPGRSDPGLVFARLAYAVRQTIALEARIAAGLDGSAPRRPPPPPPPPDPRRALLRLALHDGARPGTDRATGTKFRREVEERIEDELADDPDGDLPFGDILGAICDDLGITLDLARQPDAVIEALTGRPIDAADDEEPEDKAGPDANTRAPEALPGRPGAPPSRLRGPARPCRGPP
ncbi:MAG TPA: hypothetical protein VHY76_14690 [Acetobacteraceae bacterium]|nr:hypothetical protein [Acetobacteraceae bacterium]